MPLPKGGAALDILVVYTGGAEFSSLSRYMKYATKRRRDSIAKRRSDEDKTASLAAELLALSEIAKRTGTPPNKIAFGYGAHGKPYLKGGGLWFSLSHTKGAVCAAFGEDADGEIGVDIELRGRRVSRGLYERTLSDGERSAVHSAEDFIRVWVQKEAFLKRTGLGLAAGLRGADTLMLPDTAAFLCGEYFIGASGRGALSADLRCVPLEELLGRFGG